MLYAVLALVSALLAAGSFYWLQMKEGGMLALVLGIVFVILTVAFGAAFLSGRVNKTEDIHITE